MAEELRQENDAVGEWEAGLPTADTLPPLSKSLIPPELASAFKISPEPPQTAADLHRASQSTLSSLRPLLDPDDPDPAPDSKKARRSDDDDDDDEDQHQQTTAASNKTITLKKPRLVWTSVLHNRFVEAVDQLGLNAAVPKTIMELMKVEGLTRENVASHLQKYRMYLKRRGLTNNNDVGSSAEEEPSNANNNSNNINHMSMPPPIAAAAAVPYHQHHHLPQMSSSSSGHAFPGYYHQQQQQQSDWSGKNEEYYKGYSHR